ncbi:MAG: GDP-L-fucose synthase family protein, partial [Elusimicrobiales bacterium]
SNILQRLKDKGYNNFVLRTKEELDIRRQSDTEKLFDLERPEYVFLSAAKVGGILANNTYKAEFIYDNLAISLNIIHSSYKYGVKKLLNLGSSCIYPKMAPQPIKEEYLLTGYLEPTNEAYAVAKIAAIKLCRYYNEQYGTNYISVMPTNLYGRGDNYNLETAHVLPSLMRKFHLAKLLSKKDYDGIVNDIKQNPLGFGLDERINLKDEKSIKQTLNQLGIYSEYVVMWGSGNVYREFLYVEDLADACIFLMENYDYKDIGELVNIGTGEDLKLKDLARMIKDIVGFDGEIKHDLSKPDGTPRKLLDVSKLFKLGWRPKITLEEGIKKAYREYSGKN